MTDYAKAVWQGSPNFSLDRDGHNPNWTADDPNTWIVLHTTVGTADAAKARFWNAQQQASSTYLVKLDGVVWQFVAEKDAPWTNGTYADNPGSNLDSITIEHEDGGDYNGPRTPALYEASAQLLADIHKRRGIPLVHRGAGGGVLGHKECGPNGQATGCPDGLDLARIIARANEILNPPPPPDTRPEWQRNLHALAAAQTFQLLKPVNTLDLVTGAVRGTVQPGALTVAYETSVAGVAYWMTAWGATNAKGGDGLRKDAVLAAVTPPPPPPPPPAPVYSALAPDGTPIFTDGSLSAVEIRAHDWQLANRGQVVNVTKDGQPYEVMPAIPPDPPPPTPPPDPIPEPPADFWKWLRALIDWITRHLGTG